MTPREFGERFFDFAATAFRVEARDAYAVSAEAEAMRRFLAGEPYGLEWLDGWLRAVAGAAAQGRAVRRVRVVSRPLGDYARFGLDVARHAVRAGEEIRYLPRERAAALGVPERDCWLFDDARLALLDFDGDGVLRAVEPVTDPALVASQRAANELAWREAVPAEAFARAVLPPAPSAPVEAGRARAGRVSGGGGSSGGPG
ncbi:DUF6879 family protein [Nonomuraea pusilla]|uniref:DUF6879 domain-containing protein n=1 Tax=Nonomuraea pusilla TaxID=46177 RepID=A0A1H7LQ28_9ACTN|nr:DUF6879 family protein [Nonomuraea pusilla]SEL00949.1 hypothetical protein SAMN05660976_01637 [Nonomuraea pusilla]